jgi:predicted nucleic acid-binding protein
MLPFVCKILQITVNIVARSPATISQVVKGSLELVWSYMLDFENSKNTYKQKSEVIAKWQKLCVADVDESLEFIAMSKEIQPTGVKTADALHVACAISVGCDYFITVDGRLLKYKSDKIVVCDPVEFLRIWEDECHDE